MQHFPSISIYTVGPIIGAIVEPLNKRKFIGSKQIPQIAMTLHGSLEDQKFIDKGI